MAPRIPNQTPPDPSISTPASTSRPSGRMAFPSPQNASTLSTPGLVHDISPNYAVESLTEWERDGTLCLRFPRLPSDVKVIVRVEQDQGRILMQNSIRSPFSSYRPNMGGNPRESPATDRNGGLRSMAGGSQVYSDPHEYDIQNDEFAPRFQANQHNAASSHGRLQPSPVLRDVHGVSDEEWFAFPTFTSPLPKPEYDSAKPNSAQLQYFQPESPARSTIDPQNVRSANSREYSPAYSVAESSGTDRRPGAEGKLEDETDYDEKFGGEDDVRSLFPV